MTRKQRKPDAPLTLSPQQKTALWLFATGNTVVQVAEIMGVKMPTAKEHLFRAYRALGARNGTNAVHIAYQEGIFQPPALVDAMAAAEKIQMAATQLGIMASATTGVGLAKMFGDIARSLNLALVDMNHDTAESPRDGMARALEGYGIFDVKPEFLGLVYEGHPEIGYALDVWDWADPEVSEDILEHTICDMLGMNQVQYQAALMKNKPGLLDAFWAAHEQWS